MRGSVRISIMTFTDIIPLVLDGLFETHCASLCRGTALTVKNHGPIRMTIHPYANFERLPLTTYRLYTSHVNRYKM